MELITLFVMAAIIYGVVGLFTARNGPMRPPQRRPAPPPRPQPDTRSEQRPWTMERTPTTVDRSKQQKLKQAQGVEGTWGDEGRTIQEQWSPEGTSDYISTSAIGAKPGASTATGKANEELTFDERSLVQGVIWAEVLGKPRSLRPFRSR